MITAVELYAENCDGSRYEGKDGVPEVPQGAGPRCMILQGQLEQGDTISIDGTALVTTFDAKAKTVRSMWNVPHGGGKESFEAQVVVTRAGQKSPSRKIMVAARHVSSTGNDSGLGNAASPWATLSRALLDSDGDWISLVDAPTKQDAPAGGFAVGTGVTIASKTAAPVALAPPVGFELQARARLLRLTIDCGSVAATSACVVARGKDVVLDETSLAHSAGPGVHLKLEGASVAIKGGSFVDAAILAEAKGNIVQVRGSSFVLPAGTTAGITAQDPSPGSQTVEIGFEDVTTKFTSSGSPWIRVDGANAVSVRNVTGTGGGSGAAFAEVGAVDLRNIVGVATLAKVSIASAATGVYAGAMALELDGVQVTDASVGAVLSGSGTKAVIKGLVVLAAKIVGVRLDAGEVAVPGSLAVKWATLGTYEWNSPQLGIDVRSGNVTVTGSATVERSGGASIQLNGGNLVSMPAEPGTGVRVHDSRGSALRVLRGNADLRGGGFTSSEVSAAGGMVDITSPVPCHVTLRGTTFEFAGSTAIPTPAPVVLPPDVAPKKHVAKSGQPVSVYVLLDQPNPRELLHLEVINGINQTVDSYIELLPPQ